MDAQTIKQAVEWVQMNVGERTSKKELVQKSQSSNLPGEAKSALQDLPDGQYSKQDVISNLQSKTMAGIGGGKSGGGGLGGMIGG